MFDVKKLEEESGLSSEVLRRIETQVREEFPEDEMMYELHLVRIFHALKKGWLKVEDIFKVSVS